MGATSKGGRMEGNGGEEKEMEKEREREKGRERDGRGGEWLAMVPQPLIPFVAYMLAKSCH